MAVSGSAPPTKARCHMKRIRAEIIGETFARARVDGAEIAVGGHAPVLRLCRELVDRGIDPGTPLEAYRCHTLCLAVTSIGKAACLTVKSAGNGALILAVEKGA